MEAVGVGGVGLVEDFLPVGADGYGGAVVDRGGRVQADSGMPVVVIVVVEESVAEGAGVGQGAESVRETRDSI